MLNKSCSFIGHRTIQHTKELEIKINNLIECLIIKFDVSNFLFGSRSEFNTLCYSIVSKLKEKYTNIKRISYTCKSEICIYEKERDYWENVLFKISNKKISLFSMEEEVEHKTKYTAGKASYIERNFAMIDDGDYCIFYYDNNYKPNMNSKKKFYSSNSGTKIAYEYAKRKKKIIYNIF